MAAAPSAENLFTAARQGDLASIEAILAADPSLVNARNNLGQSALLLAKYHRQQPAVDLLLSKNPDLTLHEACAAGAEATVKKIAGARGAKAIDAHSADGFTPLALACFFGHRDIAAYLIDHGANLNLAANNPMKVAPIHAAVSSRSDEIVRLLVAAGADVNAKQQQNWTPLHAAAQHGNLAITQLLLEHGADRAARSDSGQTPLDLALTGGHGEVAAALEG